MTAPTIRAIVDATASHFGLARTDLLSMRSARALARPRQIAMYLAKRLTSRSLPEIGRHIGGRDHTTIMHGIGRIEEMSADPQIAAAIAAITSRLGTTSGAERESDPAVVAIDLVSGARRATSISVDEIEGLARLIVGWGRTLGAISVEGEPDGRSRAEEIEDDPELLLVAGVDAVRVAYSRWATARFTPAERGALDALTRALLALFETRSNM